MSKTLLSVIVIIIVIPVVILGIRFLSGPEDTWVCQDGQWVKHGNPSAEMPIDPCVSSSGFKTLTTEKGNKDIIKIKNPLPGDSISSPLRIEGEARGTWYFEASFPVKLLDKSGNVLATGIAQAQSDWMTENFVAFKVGINFAVVDNMDAVLVLIKDNPSDLPENSDQAEIPIKLMVSSETTTLKISFNNSKMDPEFSCNKVFPVERIIAKTETPARATLELLLAGNLTNEEKAAGFSTSINPGVKIQSLTIENGVAKVDFNEQLQYQVGGSCRVSAIRAQITETLKQFPTVSSVVISIDGRTEDILQP